MSVMHITSDNFQKEVLKSDKTVLLDFWADWCSPCRQLGPIIEEIARERPDIKVCKVDVSVEQELASAFQVLSIPTLVVLKEGKVVNRNTGLIPKEQILALL